MRNMRCAAVCVAVCALAVAGFADGECKNLKDAFKGRFFVGAAVNPRVYRNASSPEARLAAREFNTITAENDMKPQSLQPVEGKFRWDAADRFVAFGETNGMKGGVADGMSWLNNFPVRGRTDYPLLFDRSLKPKPCAAAVLRLAEAASGDASGQKKSDQSNK